MAAPKNKAQRNARLARPGGSVAVCKHIIAYADKRDAKPCPVCELVRWKSIALLLKKYGTFVRRERQYSGDMPLIFPRIVCVCCNRTLRGGKGNAKDCELRKALTSVRQPPPNGGFSYEQKKD